jgi:hypothetical protein
MSGKEAGKEKVEKKTKVADPREIFSPIILPGISFNPRFTLTLDTMS